MLFDDTGLLAELHIVVGRCQQLVQKLDTAQQPRVLELLLLELALAPQ